MATSYGGMVLQMEESLRKADIDALIVELAAADTDRNVALILADFIGFPRVKREVDLTLGRIEARRHND